MEYINKNRKIGLTGLMRVMNDETTLAASIDSCVQALDELIITYNDCTDNSPEIIAQKKQQYPDKIQVIPYPYHVYGINLTEEEYEYAKSLPLDSPHLLAGYYNNALKHVNYKYVVKIDADQIYFSDKLDRLRNDIINGVHMTWIERKMGSLIATYFAIRRSNKKLWSKWHPRYYLQYVLIPCFKHQYYKYVISEMLAGRAYIALSGVNAVCIDSAWYSPMGCYTGYGLWSPYNGQGDTLVFEATENTYYIPWDLTTYTSNNGSRTYIERFVFEERVPLNIGLIWFHLKPMQADSFQQLREAFENNEDHLVLLSDLRKLSYQQILKYVNLDEYSKSYYNFVHNLDKKSISKNLRLLKTCSYIWIQR